MHPLCDASLVIARTVWADTLPTYDKHIVVQVLYSARNSKSWEQRRGVLLEGGGTGLSLDRAAGIFRCMKTGRSLQAGRPEPQSREEGARNQEQLAGKPQSHTGPSWDFGMPLEEQRHP